MMWARLIGVMPFFLSGAVCAQSGNANVTGLESCFRSTRLADTICTKQNDPAERLNCLKKANAAQLECLEHVLPEGLPASERSSGASPPGPPANAAPSHASSAKTPSRTESPEMSTGSTGNGSKSPPKADFKTNPPQVPASSGTPTVAIRSHEPAEKADIPPRTPDANWLVSETSSPLDYSPLVTAVIHPTPAAKDGPNSLTIRCSGQRTELSVRMQGEFSAPRKGEPRVDYQINDQPTVTKRWTWSTEGKIATYKDDPVEFLQSVPEGGTLKIAVSDIDNVRHQATFQLAGLDPIRKKVGMACKWGSAQTKASSEKK